MVVSAAESSALATSGKWQTTTTPARSATKAKPAPQAQPSVQAEAAEPAQPSLNPTGKAISMSVPFKDAGHTLGDVTVRISSDSSVSVQKAVLVENLKTVMDAKSQAAFAAIADAGGWVALSDVQAAGFAVKFDSGLMELAFEPTADQRPAGDISLMRPNLHTSAPSAAAERPADVSGYLNLFAGADLRWPSETSRAETGVRLEAESVFRFWNIVVENEFGYDGSVDSFLCPLEAQCNVQHRAGFKRRGSRVVYDMPGQQLRLHLGDTTTQGAGFQAQPDLLGFRLDYSPRTFSPGESLRPTGRQTFRLERPAEVEVQINGATVQQLKLRPGTYNLSDLPLQAGANNVTLVITDESGDKRTLNFTSFSDANLLAQGRMEWSGSVGVPSFIRDNGREYLKDAWIGSAFARYGLTDQMTGELNLQSDNKVTMGGGGVFTALPIGFLSLQGAASHSSSGIGYSASLNYDLSNVQGLLYGMTGLRESFRFSVEHRSDAFRTPGEFQATASGILLPQYNYSWRFTAAYTAPITSKLSATLSGRYQIGNDNAFKISPLTVSRDRYGLDLSLNSTVTDWLSGSLTVGWGNDSPTRSFASKFSDEPEFRVGVRFYVRPSEKTRVSGRYDSRHHDAGLSGAWSSQKGYERWDASADVLHAGRTETVASAASVGYAGNRGEMRVTHASGFHGSDSTLPPDNRTSVRAGAGIAFAGTSVAVGAPVRGNGFAIVSGHETIAGKPITVGPKDAPRAEAGMFGPALVSNLPPYANTTLEVDVDDLPTGYSLGSGGFDIRAPYRGGYALEVGSAFSVSVYGTLEKANGEPVGLITGTATSEKHPGKQIPIFTNSSGKFGAEGLAPGLWTIAMATDDAPTNFVIDIPKGADGLFKAGTLKPVGAKQAASR